MKLILLLLPLLCVACASSSKPDFLANLNTNEKMQIIKLDEKGSALYAQNDIALYNKSFEEELSKLKPSWKEKLDSAKTNETIGIIGLTTQFVTLAFCPFNLWACFGSIGIGYTVTVPQSFKSIKKKNEVALEYNKYIENKKVTP